MKKEMIKLIESKKCKCLTIQEMDKILKVLKNGDIDT